MINKLKEVFPIHYQSGNILLICADCMDVMKHIDDKEFQLSCVDPPYGIGEDGKKNHSRGHKGIPATRFSIKFWDKEPPLKEYFQELLRVSANQIIFGGNYFIDHLYSSPCMIVWDKLNSGDFADCELAWTSFMSAVRKFSYRWNGMLQGDMKHKEKRIHPTQKPIALYRWIFQNYAKPGQLIIDTHLGSGSSAIAAHYSGLDFVGCELDQEYFDASVKRFKAETRQQGLFEPGKDIVKKFRQESII